MIIPRSGYLVSADPGPALGGILGKLLVQIGVGINVSGLRVGTHGVVDIVLGLDLADLVSLHELIILGAGVDIIIETSADLSASAGMAGDSGDEDNGDKNELHHFGG